MRRRLASLAAAGFLLAVLPAGLALGALPRELILAGNMTTGQTVMMLPDGSGLTTLACGGDLTRGAGTRFFVRAESVGGGYPHVLTELFAYDEDCGGRTQLSDDPNVERVIPRWSPNGLRVAYGGERIDPLTGEVLRGIYVAEVVLDASSAPTAIADERLAVPLPNENLVVSWASDNCRVAYEATPAGTTNQDVFVADLCGGLPATGTNLTNTATLWESRPAFHPSLDRIAFARQLNKGGPVRFDIYVLDLLTGATTQVTSKNNANLAQIGNPAWSPDGQHLAFHASSVGNLVRMDVYRIPADGKQKAVSLTAAYPGTGFAGPIWRG